MKMGAYELASWGGLTYYMIEEDQNALLVLVVNQKGKKAIFDLSTGAIRRNELELEDERIKAQRMIRDYRHIFMDYWNEIKAKARV